MWSRAGSNATLFESNAGPLWLVPYVCLTVLLGIKIGLQWFITPYQVSRTLGSHPRSHPHPPSFPIDLFAKIVLARSIQV